VTILDGRVKRYDKEQTEILITTAETPQGSVSRYEQGLPHVLWQALFLYFLIFLLFKFVKDR